MPDAELVTGLHGGVRGYQSFFLSAPILWEWSGCVPHTWRSVWSSFFLPVHLLPVSSLLAAVMVEAGAAVNRGPSDVG